MKINNFSVNVRLLYSAGGRWETASLTETKNGFLAEYKDARTELVWEKKEDVIHYELKLHSSFPTQVRLELELLDEEELFHLIPSNLFGDNNLEKAQPGEYPMLTTMHPEDVFCSPFWEFRADRASQPVSILCCKKGAVGISIAPYTQSENGYIRNGVRAELPNKIAVTLGYTNDPVTFLNKREYLPGTRHTCCDGCAKGRIYGVSGNGRLAAHEIVEAEYGYTREVPVYHKSLIEAAQALADQFVKRNWSETFQNYTNMACHLPEDKELKAWRQLTEIGWTGGGILSYPFMLAQELLKLPEDYFQGRFSPSQIVDQIVDNYCEESGFFNDVTRPDWNPAWEMSPVNGWWSGFYLAFDCHCAYTNGSAVYYILKGLVRGKEKNLRWQEAALKVLDTVMSLQREDGNYGYTYKHDKKEVLAWDGFAGCWFAAAMPYAYELTGKCEYLESARRALDFYVQFVKELNCYGTPMDTWKSVDEEGNLAFIRGASHMHRITGEEMYLEYLELGARYQYLWQYGFRAKPEFQPLRGSGWNSCGGSVTSVSNPHIHPMASLVIEDIEYLAEKTKSAYHRQRAEDMLAWVMQTMELYPEVSGYGEYGVMTERYCPSDGLVIEKYGNGEPASMWFTYNGWAAANSLEAILEKLRIQNIK